MGVYIPNLEEKRFYEICKEHNLDFIAIPAADVRPVVFCKDCKHRGNTPDCPFCWLADKKMGDDHFCSFGEKREES